MKKILTLGLAAFAALLFLSLAGCGGALAEVVRFNMPTRALVATNGYTAGDLVVSAHFLSDTQIEILSAEYRYSHNGENYVIPSAKSTFNRQASGEWTSSSSEDLSGKYQVCDTVVSRREQVSLCGWTFVPAALIKGAKTAAVRRPGITQTFLPILPHSSPSWCKGDFQPEWVVAMSSNGKKLLAIGSLSNSHYTRPDGKVELPMAVLESD